MRLTWYMALLFQTLWALSYLRLRTTNHWNIFCNAFWDESLRSHFPLYDMLCPHSAAVNDMLLRLHPLNQGGMGPLLNQGGNGLSGQNTN